MSEHLSKARPKNTSRFFAQVAIVVAILSSNGIQPTFADEPAPAATKHPTRDAVLELVNQLDAEQRTLRVKAESMLLDLGPAILPLLPPPELLANAQTRETVRRIRLKLERQKALNAAKPTRVTLTGEFTLDAAVESISKQTGNLIDLTAIDADVRSRRLSFDASDVSFWQAIDRVCDVAGRAIVNRDADATNRASAPPAVKLGTPGELPARSEHVELDQPVRTSLNKASVRQLFGDDQHDKVRVGLEFQVEPRLRPLFLKYRAREITASITNGKSQQPLESLASADDSLELPLGEDGRRIAIHADFRLPRSTFENKRELMLAASGKLVMQCAAATERLVVSDVTRSKGVVRRRGGVSMLIRNVDVEQDGTSTNLNMQCVVTYDTGGPAFESHRTWLFHNLVYLESKPAATGRINQRQSPASFEINGQADGGVMVTYQFSKLPKSLMEGAFVYHAPTLIVDVPVKFEFDRIRVAKDER